MEDDNADCKAAEDRLKPLRQQVEEMREEMRAEIEELKRRLEKAEGMARAALTAD